MTAAAISVAAAVFLCAVGAVKFRRIAWPPHSDLRRNTAVRFNQSSNQEAERHVTDLIENRPYHPKTRHRIHDINYAN